MQSRLNLSEKHPKSPLLALYRFAQQKRESMNIRLSTILILTTLFISCAKEITNVSTVSNVALINADAPAKWPVNDLPITVEISSSFAAEENLIQDMGYEWETIGNNEQQFFTFTTGVANEDHTDLSIYRDSKIGVYKSTQWFSQVSNYALAITQFFGYRRNAGTAEEYIELTHGDIIVNYKYFNFSTNQSAGTYDLPSVILHEMGHLVGLYHIYDAPAVMAPTISSQEDERVGYEADEIAIARNYDINSSILPLESSNAVIPGASSIPVRYSDPSQEGELVSGYHELMADGSCNLHINN